MSFNISNFKEKFSGYTRSAHFEATITLPLWAQAKGYNDADFLRIRCHTTNLPGTDINLFSGRRNGSGPSELYPIGVNFGPITMTFYNDEQSKILNLFREWAAHIVDIGQNSSDDSFRVHYRSDYISTINIDQFDQTGKVSARYRMIDAFPASVSSSGLSWAATDQITELSATFVYKNYFIIGENDPVVGTPSKIKTTVSQYPQTKLPTSTGVVTPPKAKQSTFVPGGGSFGGAGASTGY
jgi:hypothetical protein